METKSSRVSRRIFLPGMIGILASVLLLYACRKNSSENLSEKNTMVTARETLAGDMISGKVNIESNGDEIVINYNDGDRYILVGKISGVSVPDLDNLKSVTLVASKYGLVIQDISSNKVFFLVNNDNNSIDQFKKLASTFNSDFQTCKIFGTTIVNAEKS